MFCLFQLWRFLASNAWKMLLFRLKLCIWPFFSLCISFAKIYKVPCSRSAHTLSLHRRKTLSISRLLALLLFATITAACGEPEKDIEYQS